MPSIPLGYPGSWYVDMERVREEDGGGCGQRSHDGGGERFYRVLQAIVKTLAIIVIWRDIDGSEARGNMI